MKKYIENKQNSFLFWLNQLEKNITALMRTYPLNQDVKARNVADIYFHNACQAYLNIIAKIKVEAAEPATLAKNIPSLLNPENPLTKAIMTELKKIDTVRFVPHIFHPVFNAKKGRYFMEDDKPCYLLAKTLQDAIGDLQKTEGGLIMVSLKKFAGHKLSKILRALSDRMFRFEYNNNNRFNICYYEKEVVPNLNQYIDDVSNEALTEAERIEQIKNANRYICQALQDPIVIPQFLRDESLLVTKKLISKDAYPALLTQYLTEMNLDDKEAIELYGSEIDARNVFIGYTVEQYCTHILKYITEKFSRESHPSLYPFIDECQENFKKLTQRNKECEDIYSDQAGLKAWGDTLFTVIDNLMKSLSSFAKFNPNAMNVILKATPKKLRLTELCHELYDSVYPCWQIAQGRDEMYAVAKAMVLQHVNSTVLELIDYTLKMIANCNIPSDNTTIALQNCQSALTPLATFKEYIEANKQAKTLSIL